MVMIVYDVANEESFKDCKQWLEICKTKMTTSSVLGMTNHYDSYLLLIKGSVKLTSNMRVDESKERVFSARYKQGLVKQYYFCLFFLFFITLCKTDVIEVDIDLGFHRFLNRISHFVEPDFRQIANTAVIL